MYHSKVCNVVILNLLYSSKKIITVPTKKFSSTTIFNIDNKNKYLLCSKSAY